MIGSRSICTPTNKSHLLFSPLATVDWLRIDSTKRDLAQCTNCLNILNTYELNGCEFDITVLLASTPRPFFCVFAIVWNIWG